MKFNKSRFARLAGLPQSRGTLNESRRRKAMRRRAMLNEGLYGGRSERMIDTFDPFDDEEVEMVRYDDDMGRRDMRRLDMMPNYSMDDLGPSDYESMSRYEDMYDDDDDFLYEASHHQDEMKYEMDDVGEMHYEADMEEEGMDHMMYEEEEEASEGGMYEDDVEEMIEISDADLMKEVSNIKRKRINEARLKAVIEDELREVLAEMQYGSSWMYGEDKPRASKKGQVTKGFKGLGFK